MRKTLIIICALLLVFILGVWLYNAKLDDVSKTAIEKQGSEILQTAVVVGQIHIDHKSGEGEIKNLTVANPSGFNSPQAFLANETTVKLAPQTRDTSVVMINTLNIQAPSIHIEQNNAGNNMQILQQHIEHFIQAETEHPNKVNQRFIIGSFSLVNATLYVHAPLKQPDVITIPLADIRLNYLGQDQGGMTSAQILDLVMEQLNQNMAQALASRDLGNLIDLQALGVKPPSLSDKILNFFKKL